MATSLPGRTEPSATATATVVDDSPDAIDLRGITLTIDQRLRPPDGAEQAQAEDGDDDEPAHRIAVLADRTP